MFSDFLRRLTAPAPDRLTDTDARLAIGALFVRIARADGDYAAAEIARIDRVLASRYGLTAADAAALRLQCEGIEEEAPDTVRFTRAIKDGVPYEDRAAVIEALWEIALADGQREQEEDALLRMVAPMLGLTDQESALIRQRIEARQSGRAG
jgi:uncharacterized tellurite resistance protein B-like protein